MKVNHLLSNKEQYTPLKESSIIQLVRPFLVQAATPGLPYAANALMPYISANTVNSLYSQHYAAHLSKLKQSVAGTPCEHLSLGKVIKESARKRLLAHDIFDSAAHIWLYEFYWAGLKIKSGDKLPPCGHLLRLIERDFGCFSNSTINIPGKSTNLGFKELFIEAGLNYQGNGWLWLVMDKGKLKIVTSNQTEVFFTEGLKPLFVIGLAEQFYSLDYPKKRVDYLNAILNNLINWQFVANNLRRMVY